MMSQNLKRLAKIEAALLALQQKRKICLFLDVGRDWSMKQIETAADALIEQAIASGRLDPQTQEAMVIRFLTIAEDQSMADKVWHPEAREQKREPRPVMEEPLEPLPEPEPERPTPINYPSGLAPY
jgi:hypothetical protein